MDVQSYGLILKDDLHVYVYTRSKCKAFLIVWNSSELHLQKLTPKWGQQKLTQEQKRQRVHVARDLFSHFELGGCKCMTDVTGEEETWVPFYSTF